MKRIFSMANVNLPTRVVYSFAAIFSVRHHPLGGMIMLRIVRG